MKKLIAAALVAGASTVALANNVVTETSTWKSVPITVDTNTRTYTVQGPLPEADYYYSYAGYRCLKEKKNITGVDAFTLRPGVSGGSDIYCYPVLP